MRKLTIVLVLAVLAACAKKTVPEGSVKGIAKFQLGGGAAISQPDVDDYNPQVLQQGDNFLVLVFASNRSCGTCSGHNLFIARSTVAYNNDASFPAFENPTVMTVTGTPLNYANPIAFVPVLSGNNIRIYLTNSGGTIQQTAVMTPGGSYDTTLSAITNTTGAANATILGSEFTGSAIYARQNGTVYSFAQNTTNTPVAMATGQNATSVTSVDGSFTSRYDGFFSLVDGTIAAMSLYGNGGNLVSVNTAIAKARLSARYISVLRGGGFKGGLMFISGVESGGTTQDMYVVDGMTVWQMWQLINPKPPGATDGGSTPVATTTADPAFSPVAGHYGTPINVTMTSTTSGAIICYTTDGVTDPVCSATPTCTTGTTYSSAVAVTYTKTDFRARACKAGLSDSAVVAATHISDATQPSTPGTQVATANGANQIDLTWAVSTDSGVNSTPQAQLVYEICQSTTLTGCSSFATVNYTTAANASNYSVTGLAPSTIYYFRVRARDLAGNVSPHGTQTTATTAATPTVSTPTFSPVAGTFNATQNVTISSTTGGATICYSTDGVTTPACDAVPTCTAGSLYSSALNIAATTTLKAIGCKNGSTASSVANGVFTIDATAPASVSTLAAGTVTSTSIQLNWTAVGDDNNTGTATSYELRYLSGGSCPISAGSFASGTLVGSMPAPAIAGTATETKTVTGLSASTSYCFAIKVLDEVSNTSGISNVVSQSTSATASTTASRVYGQLGSFATGGANAGGLSANSLSIPNSIAFDAGGVYVADFSNNRVLYYSGTSTTASRVYGQLGSFTSNTANNGGVSADSLNLPNMVAVDANGVYIADSNNYRVLFYSGTSTTASRVYGQLGSFTSNTINNGGISANSLSGTQGLAADSTGVYIGDASNNRVLYFSGVSTTATRVYGQFGSFTCAQASNNGSCAFGSISANSLNSVASISVDATGVYIAEWSSNRVLYYAGTSTTATRVYGQLGSFSTGTANNGGRSANSLDTPYSVASDGSGVFIADFSNNRVLYYVGTSTTATRVYGQLGSFSTGAQNNGGLSANSLYFPAAVAVNANGVYIGDRNNNRVLFY